MLTKGLDNYQGTSGNDTIIGSIANGTTDPELNTLSPLDIINGGAGVDTLKIADNVGAAIALPNVTNVEIIEVQAVGAANINTSTTAGVTNLNVTKAAGAVAATAAATTDVNVAVKGIAGTTVTVNGGKDVTVTTTDAAAAIDVGATGTDPVGAVTITATGAAATNNTDVTMGNIAVGGGKTVSVTQKATSNASAIVADGTTETVTQGNVVVTANATTTDVTVKQDAEATAASTAAVTGATEVASVKFTKLDAGESVTISGLTFTAATGKNLTADQVAQAFANLSASAIKPTDVTPTAATGDTNGGSASANGTFTGALLADWTSGAATGDTVVFTGKANTAMAIDLVASAKATVTTTTQGVTAVTAQNTLGVANGTVTIAGAAALKTVTVDGYAASVGPAGINGATNNALDTINLANGGNFEVDSAAAALGLNLTNVDGTVTVTAGTKTLNAAVSHAKATETSTLVSASAETVNVTGTGNVAGDTTAGLTAATAINTSAMTAGNATFTIADGTVTSYTGGAGVDSVTVSNANVAITKAIDLGAGDDTLTLNGAAVAPTATLKGGEGTDIIAMTGARAEALSVNSTFAGKIEGFEKLSITDKVTAATTVNMANMDGITYVVSNNGTADAAVPGNPQEYDFDIAGLSLDAAGTLSFGGVVVHTATGTENDAAIAGAIDGTTVVIGGVTYAITASGTDINLASTTNVAPQAAITVTTTGETPDGSGNPQEYDFDIAGLSLDAAGTLSFGGVVVHTATGTENDAAIAGAIDGTTVVIGGVTYAITASGTDINLASTTNVATQAAITVTTTGETPDGSGNPQEYDFDIAGLVLNETGELRFGGVTVYTAPGDLTNAAAIASAIDGDTVEIGGVTYAITATGTAINLASTTNVATQAAIVVTAHVAVGTGITDAAVTPTPGAADAATGITDAAVTPTPGAADAATGITDAAVTPTPGAATADAVPYLTIDKMANDGTLELVGAGAGVVVTMADATGSTDSFNIVTKVSTVAAGGLDFGTVDVAGVETLKLNAVDTQPTVAGAASIQTATLDIKADKATSLTIEGNSNVTLTLDATTNKLATIDAGTLTGKLDAGNTLNAVAMTITGGSGADVLKASVGATAKADVLNGGDGNDTLYAGSNGAKLTGGAGNDLFFVTANSTTVGSKESNTYSEILDFQAGDLLQLQASNAAGNAAIDITGFTKLAAVLNENTAEFSDFVNAAIKEAGAGAAVYFNFKGDAYIAIDSANSTDAFANGEDMVVKLTGINGDNLSFNSDFATVALI